MDRPSITLIVEDEPLIALSLQAALEDAGYPAHYVGTGEEAFAILQSRRSRINAVVTDIRLGASLDGWAVARHAREFIANVPVVYTSGDCSHSHTIHGVPGSVMLPKPFAPAQVITALSLLLNAPARDAA